MSLPRVSIKSRPIEDTVPVETSFALWGYAYTGDGSEFSAVVSENNPTVVINTFRNGCAAWDRSRTYLDSVERWNGDQGFLRRGGGRFPAWPR